MACLSLPLCHSASPPAWGRINLSILHLSTATAAGLAGWHAGMLACWHGVTAERSRPVPSHFIPPSHESWSTQQPAANTPRAVIVLLSSLAATPRPWSGRAESDDQLRSISCTSPAMVFHRQPLGHEPIAKTHKQATETCGQTFPCPPLRRDLSLPPTHTHTPSRSFPDLHTSSCPGLSWVCQPLQSARHVLVKATRLLGVVRTIYPFKRWA